MANPYARELRTLAISAFVISLLLTAIGGLVDITGEVIYFTKRHAWNDGLYLAIAALFLLMLSNM